MAEYDRILTPGLTPTTWSVNIGRDGGVLMWDSRQPVPVWRIDGARVSEREAWVWIYRWHRIRDALKTPCGCKPCAWFREEADRLCPKTPAPR